MMLLSQPMVEEAAEYDSACVNTLRRSQDGYKLLGCQSNLVADLTLGAQTMKIIYPIITLLLLVGCNSHTTKFDKKLVQQNAPIAQGQSESFKTRELISKGMLDKDGLFFGMQMLNATAIHNHREALQAHEWCKATGSKHACTLYSNLARGAEDETAFLIKLNQENIAEIKSHPLNEDEQGQLLLLEVQLGILKELPTPFSDSVAEYYKKQGWPTMQ